MAAACSRSRLHRTSPVGGYLMPPLLLEPGRASASGAGSPRRCSRPASSPPSTAPRSPPTARPTAAGWRRRSELSETPTLYKTPSGYVQQSPWLGIVHKQLELMGRYMVELGLDTRGTLAGPWRGCPISGAIHGRS